MSKTVVAQSAPAPPQEVGTVLRMIDRLIERPDIPVERLEQLFDLHRKVETDLARKKYAAAMAKCQQYMRPVVAKADNPQTRSKYASYDALDAAVRPIYSANGFALSYNTETPAPDMLRVIAYVTHESGFERQFQIDMPADGKGAKGAKGGDVMTKTHATGSALTYGKRYLLGSIFNIATTKDDDGNAAGGGVITCDQAEELALLITDSRTDIAKFLEMGGIDSLSDLPAKQFKAAKSFLMKKLQERTQK